MRYSRGRIIALTILSVTMVLALFGAGLLLSFRDLTIHADNTNENIDYDKVTGFDDWYQRVKVDTTVNTGSYLIGQDTRLTLREESYPRDTLKNDFLNKEGSDRSFSRVQASRYQIMDDDLWYPVFNQNEMRSIVEGKGSDLQIPVVMLNPNVNDDIVLFEITGMSGALKEDALTIKRNGRRFEHVYNVTDKNYQPDQVAAGIPETIALEKSGTVYDPAVSATDYAVKDTDNTTVVLNLAFVLNDSALNGYVVEVKNSSNSGYLRMRDKNNNLVAAKVTREGETVIYNDADEIAFKLHRDGSNVSVYNAQDMLLGEYEFNRPELLKIYYKSTGVEILDANRNNLFIEDSNHDLVKSIPETGEDKVTLYNENHVAVYQVSRVRQMSNNVTTIAVYNLSGETKLGELVVNPSQDQLTNSYKLGAVGYNNSTLRGMFREEGFYQIELTLDVNIGDNITKPRVIKFDFIIVNKSNYINSPHFDSTRRARGLGEIYKYPYESTYPELRFQDSRFDVKITSTAEPLDKVVGNVRRIQFQKIGEYTMDSTLRYYSTYYGQCSQEEKKSLNKRGIDESGYITLKNYTQYSSVLKISGFQAYWAGHYHEDTGSREPEGFYDDTAENRTNSDITAWLKEAGWTKNDRSDIADKNNMSVSEAKNYANDLANYLTNETKKGRITPVSTNCPPVILKSNVKHAPGAGNGETTVLSTVSYRPFSGNGNSDKWEDAKTLEVGAPFEKAGYYVVTVYYRNENGGNSELCQQTFYFEINNAYQIEFSVNDGPAQSLSDLELDKTIQGQKVKLTYNGSTSLGKFDIYPTVRLERESFDNVNNTVVLPFTPDAETGAFEFDFKDEITGECIDGRYYLIIGSGADNTAKTVYNIVVDNQPANGITVTTKAESLRDYYARYVYPDQPTQNPFYQQNIDVVGAGNATVSWQKKASGVKYTKVYYEFYPLAALSDGTNPNDGLNYANFPATTDQLFAARGFSKEFEYTTPYQVIFDRENGVWEISGDGETAKQFNQAGIYRFIIVDEVGNETSYVLVIDDTTPTFIQSGEAPVVPSNMVTFDSAGIKVGFGKHKLIGSDGDSYAFADLFYVGNQRKTYDDLDAIFTGMQESSVIVNGVIQKYNSNTNMVDQTVVRSFSIPIVKAEWSKSGGTYYEVDQPGVNCNLNADGGYWTLNEEGTFYFRVTDALGNVGEYYIILTYDRCFGSIYSESSPALEFSNTERKIIKTPVSANTAIVSADGGVTNRSYITFSFSRIDDGSSYYVDTVTVNFYPLTYNPDSKNYPFDETPSTYFGSNGLVYNHMSGDENAQMIRLALFNTGEFTPEGMYIITRVYNDDDGSATDHQARDYWFIVDRHGMLEYITDGDEVKYQTPLMMRFAKTAGGSEANKTAKDAYAADFYDYQNKLSSNRAAWTSGFESKYANQHPVIKDNKGEVVRSATKYSITSAHYLAWQKNGGSADDQHEFDFPALVPNFKYTNDGKTYFWGEGRFSNPKALGDQPTNSPIYELLIADGSRNISCMLVNGNVKELDLDGVPTSANYGQLILNLDTTHSTSAQVLTHKKSSNEPDLKSADAIYDGTTYWCIVDSGAVDQLKFTFDSDADRAEDRAAFPNEKKSMFIDVNTQATMATLIWQTANGQPVRIADQVNLVYAGNGLYTIDLYQYFRKLGNVAANNGDKFTLEIITYDNVVTRFTILFDTDKPNYNEARIKAQDNLACNMAQDEFPSLYIYGVNDDFVFEYSQQSRYLDTQHIYYERANFKGDVTSGEPIEFKLYEHNDPNKQTFADLIELRKNEMRCYKISEIDYAGHSRYYYIQIMREPKDGESSDAYYNNDVNFVGTRPVIKRGDETLGIEMRVSSSSVQQFFHYNNSFKFQSGDEYYLVLNDTAYWNINGVEGSGPSDPDELVKYLNNWINSATQQGHKCTYTLYDRIGKTEVHEFYNIRESDESLQLDCGNKGSVIWLDVTNKKNLSAIMRDLKDYFEVKIYPISNNEVAKESVYTAKGLDWEERYSIESKVLDISAEYLIEVTDPFGRISKAEYHGDGQGSATYSFVTYGNVQQERDEKGRPVTYVGDAKGIEFKYMDRVYTVDIYDQNGKLLNNELNRTTRLEKVGKDKTEAFICYEIAPLADKDDQYYRFEIKGRTSKATLLEKVFIFDTRLPKVQWRNSSEEDIDSVENRSFVGRVKFDLDEESEYKFPVTISYERTVNKVVEAVTLPEGITKWEFDQVGDYVVTFRSSIWAEKTYHFSVVKVDSGVVVVKQTLRAETKTLQTSDSPYEFQGNLIPRYVFSLAQPGEGENDYLVTDIAAHGLSVKEGQTTRKIIGRGDIPGTYYEYNANDKTIIWCLKNEGSGASPIYIATTGVPQGELDESEVTLLMNGKPDPENQTDKAEYEVSTDLAYGIIYDNFFIAERDNQIKIKLKCKNSVIREKPGTKERACHEVRGNLIALDCYYNGELVKTIYDDETFIINRYNQAGRYDFYVHDAAGNYLKFGTSNDTTDINYRTNHYTLMVMTEPVVLINGERPTDNMVYNDSVKLELVDYSAFWKQYYKELKNQNKLPLDDNKKAMSEDAFFSANYCVTNVKVVRATGIENNPEEIFENYDLKNAFYKSGSYTVTFDYYVYDAKTKKTNPQPLRGGTYTFRIIPSKTIKENFSMVIGDNMKDIKVFHNDHETPDYRVYLEKESTNKLSFAYNQHPGRFKVQWKTYDDIKGVDVDHQIEFNIQYHEGIAARYFTLNGVVGGKANGEVNISCIQYWLYKNVGEVTIVLTKDYQTIDTKKITSQGSSGNTLSLFNVSDAGVYSIEVYDAEDTQVFGTSWEIEPKQSTMGYIILAVVFGIAGIGILVFIRLRRRMTTK